MSLRHWGSTRDEIDGVVVGDDLCLFAKHQTHRPAPRHDTQRLECRVQNECATHVRTILFHSLHHFR